MTLTVQFPSFEPLFLPTGHLPPQWNDLLAMDHYAARTHIAETMGLSPGPVARSAMVQDKPIAVLIPKKKRKQRDTRHHRLAIPLCDNYTMLFSSQFLKPAPDHARYPREYIAILHSLGGCQMTQYGGELLAPGNAVDVVRSIREQLQLTGDKQGALIIEPFCAIGTGDYYCWLDGNYSQIWLFDHETAGFELAQEDGFVVWFENELAASLADCSE